MPAIVIYILKLSISLSVVYAFYQLVLRKLTFYTWNRWYLLGYSLLSFFIAFFNVTPLFRKAFLSSKAIQLVPTIHFYGSDSSIPGYIRGGARHGGWGVEAWIVVLLAAGMLFLTIKLLVQYISLQRIRRRAEWISGSQTKVYHVNAHIIPFSFGNSIFLNKQLHSSKELEEIIGHEFVHVKQKHSIDILWSELLCILNWYNPVSWLLKRCVRQNLEFIADHHVLETGMGKKEYQYLLLKVIGNNQFSIASKFNFSSLKKRIVMMNKMKTARLHMVKFLFILPLLAIMMVAFRKTSQQKPPLRVQPFAPVQVADVSLPTISGTDTTPVESSPTIKRTTSRSSDNFEITDKKAVIHLRNGKTEEYDLTDSAQRASFERNYGKIISATASGDQVTTTIATSVTGVTTAPVTTVISADGIGTTEQPAVATTISSEGAVSTMIASVNATPVSVGTNATEISDDEYVEGGKKDIELTITKNTTAGQLEQLKKQMKDKGYDLIFDKTTYSGKGLLTYVSGTITTANGHKSNFVGSDFDKIILAAVKKGDRTFLEVRVEDKPKVVI